MRTMWPYILLILSPLLIQHVRVKNVSVSLAGMEDNNKAMKAFWIMLLALLALRRDDIGVDLANYRYIFNYIAVNEWQIGLGRSSELGYNLVNKLVSLFSTNFQWLIIVVAVLSTYSMAKAYIRYTEDSSLTIALFITMSNFVLLFSGLRQCVAISIGFIAYEYVRKKRLYSYLLVVAVAILFHTSAFMLFLMYPLYHAKITKKWLFGIIPLLGIIMVFNRQVFSVLTNILNRFTKYDGEIASTGAYMMLILFAIFCIFSYIIPDESMLNADTIGMRNFLLLSVALQMFAPLHSIAMRMNYYYMAFIPLLLPKIIKYRSVRWNQVAIVARHIMVMFFVVHFFLAAPDENVLGTFPYKFFWQQV